MDKNKIKNIIEEKIKDLALEIDELRQIAKPIEPENAIGRISRMDAINNKSVVEAALRKAEEKLNKLKLVLNKVDDADFGICIRCGEPIPIGRVLLMPQSRNCVRCAQ